MSKNTEWLMHAGAEEVIEEIDGFIAGGKPVGAVVPMPQIVTIPPFKGRSLKARLANIVTKIPLRMVRKSTKDFYLYQKNINHELKHELESLKYQVQKLRKELNDRK